MNIAMAFHAGDKQQVVRWLAWVEELGWSGRHKLWLMPAKGQNADFRTSIPFNVIDDQYGIITDWSAHNGPVRDAAGANSMLRQFAWHFFLGKLGPWLFNEPDAIWLRATAPDELEDEYRASGKAYMGAKVPGKEGDYPEHSTGNMIFCEDCVAMSKLLMLPTHAEIDGRRVELAFDVVAAPDIIGPNFHETKLIQHVFRGPVFTKMDDLARVDPKAAIWHSDKDGGLIKLLRAKRDGTPVETLMTPKASDTQGVVGSTPANGNAGSIPAPSRLRVHTYFRPCVDPEALAEQKRILAIWEKNWRDAGWEPVILTEAHARKHPDYNQRHLAFMQMPTVSPKEYEMAAWLRWLAMSVVGGGFLVDYDVLNNSFIENACESVEQFPLILSDNNPVPCAVFGLKAQYDAAVWAFVHCQPGEEQGQPHLSDMLAVQMLGFPAKDICREAGTNGWDKAPLIHFSHRCCGNKRSEMMTAFIEGMGAVSTFRNPQWVNSDAPVIVSNLGVTTVAECIDNLVEFSKKDAFAMARIRKQLRKAGLLPKK